MFKLLFLFISFFFSASVYAKKEQCSKQFIEKNFGEVKFNEEFSHDDIYFLIVRIPLLSSIEPQSLGANVLFSIPEISEQYLSSSNIKPSLVSRANSLNEIKFGYSYNGKFDIELDYKVAVHFKECYAILSGNYKNY